VPVSGEYVAQTQSSRLVNIQARVTGFLDRRALHRGAMVKEGDTLFLMDQKPFQAQLDQSQAAMARQVAAMERRRRTWRGSNRSRRWMPCPRRTSMTPRASMRATRPPLIRQRRKSRRPNSISPTRSSRLQLRASPASPADRRHLHQHAEQPAHNCGGSLPHVGQFQPFGKRDAGLPRAGKKGLLRTPKDRNYLVEIILVDGSLYPHTGRITFADSSFNAQTGTFLVGRAWTTPRGSSCPTSTCGCA